MIRPLGGARIIQFAVHSYILYGLRSHVVIPSLIFALLKFELIFIRTSSRQIPSWKHYNIFINNLSRVGISLDIVTILYAVSESVLIPSREWKETFLLRSFYSVFYPNCPEASGTVSLMTQPTILQ